MEFRKKWYAVSMKATNYLLLIIAICVCVTACDRGQPPADDSPTVQSDQAQEWIELIQYTDDNRDPERRLAAIQLGVHKHTAAVDVLARHLMGDRDPQVRVACAFALGQIGGERAVQTLLAAFQVPTPQVRDEAVRALVGHVDDQVAQSLEELAKIDEEEIALLAIRVLALSGRPVDEFAQVKRTAPPAPVASDVVVYVDSVNGNDEGAGSKEKPFKSVKKGLSLLVPSGTLYIAGSRNEPIREAVIIPSKLAGQPGAPTRIIGWPGKPRPLLQPTFIAAKNTIQREGQDLYRVKTEQYVFGAFFVHQGKTISFQSAEKKEDLDTGYCWFDKESGELFLQSEVDLRSGKLELAFAEDGLRIDGAQDVLIQGIGVRYCPDSGFEANAAFRTSFVDCTTDYCVRHGIFVYYSPYSVVRNCQVRNSLFQGISLRSSPHTVVSRCLTENNRWDGILFLYDSDDCVVLDCVMRGGYRGLSFIEGSDFPRILNCLSEDNQINSVTYETGSLTGSVLETP